MYTCVYIYICTCSSAIVEILTLQELADAARKLKQLLGSISPYAPKEPLCAVLCFVVGVLLVVACWLLLVAGCSLLVVCCLLFVACCLLLVACCLLLVVCWLLCVAGG